LSSAAGYLCAGANNVAGIKNQGIWKHAYGNMHCPCALCHHVTL